MTRFRSGSLRPTITRAMETTEGRDLFALYKVARPDPPEVVEPPKSAPKGPANVELKALAASHRQANPGLSHAQAYTAMLTHPDNRELAARVKAEDLYSMQRTLAGRRLPYENPNREPDVRATMARTQR
jgi:hypothetical protein